MFHPDSHIHLFITWRRDMTSLLHILKPTANWSPYISTLVQRVKHRVYKVHVLFFFLSEAILCGDSASYFI